MKLKKLFTEPTDNGFVQFFRYIFVGAAGYIADFGIMIFLVECFKLNEIIAATVSFICGLAVNYLLSTFWIFKNSRISNKFLEFCIYAVIGVVGLLINAAVIWVFTDILAPNGVFGSWISAERYYMLGKVLSTGIVFLWNFFARKYIVFEKSK